MIGPVVDDPGTAAINTKAVSVIAANRNAIVGTAKVFIEFIPCAECFGSNRTAIGIVANVIATKAFIEIQAGRIALRYITGVGGKIHIVIKITDPGIAGAGSKLVALWRTLCQCPCNAQGCTDQK